MNEIFLNVIGNLHDRTTEGVLDALESINICTLNITKEMKVIEEVIGAIAVKALKSVSGIKVIKEGCAYGYHLNAIP